MITDYPSRNVLLCLRYGIGDVVMETPVLRALRATLPEARITLLGAPPAIELLDSDPVADRVVSLTRWGIRHRWHAGDPDARERLQAWLGREQFDLFLDVHHAAPVVGAAVWGRGIRSLEADEAVEAAAVANGADAVSAIRMAASAGWGLSLPREDPPSLHVPEETHRFAEAFLRDRGLDGSTPLALSPIASSELKRWPVERFARVADELLDEFGGPLLLFCGPQLEDAQRLRARMRHREGVVLVGAVHLQRVAALLARCRILVCNDTGLMHMAAALGVPTAGVFGPTSPEIYRPPFSHAVAVHERLQPCWLRDTGSLHPPRCIGAGRCLTGTESCIRPVSEEAVLAVVRSLLGTASPSSDLLDPVARSS
jgi:ADP-heptose:LPS heptosyltransferase